MLRILKDHADTETRRPCRLLFRFAFSMEGHAIHTHASRCRHEKATDQLHQCRFARTRLARNRCKCSPSNCQRDIVQGGV